MESYIGFKVKDMGFDAHVTVLYLGELTPKEETAARIVLHDLPQKYRGEALAVPWKWDMFGPNQDIPVLRIKIQKEFEDFRAYLEYMGLKSASEFSTWNPHVTLPTEFSNTLHVPSVLILNNLDLY